jgi:hypothetical protein
LRELERRYPDSIAVVGVHSGKYTAERITPRVADASLRLGTTHPVLNDRQFRVWRAFAVQAWPTLVAIDPRGYVVGQHAGEFTADGVAPFVERVLAEARAAGSLAPSAHHTVVDAPTTTPSLLAFPGKVALHGARLAIADSAHHRVLIGALDATGHRMRIERIAGSTSAGFADGPSAAFDNPQGLAFHGHTLFVADAGNHAVRAIDLDSGHVRTLAGTGHQGRTARDLDAGALSSPWDLTMADDTLFVAMAGVHQIWSIDPATGRAAPHAGSRAEELHDAPLAEAALAQPMGITRAGNLLIVADAESSAVRTVDLDPAGAVRTLVGTGLFDFGDIDGAGDDARLQHPQGVAAASDGRLLVCDSYNDSLRWLDPATRRLSTWVRGLHEPGGVALGDTAAYVADTNAHRVVVVDRTSGEMRPLVIDVP